MCSFADSNSSVQRQKWMMQRSEALRRQKEIYSRI